MQMRIPETAVRFRCVLERFLAIAKVRHNFYGITRKTEITEIPTVLYKVALIVLECVYARLYASGTVSTYVSVGLHRNGALPVGTINSAGRWASEPRPPTISRDFCAFVTNGNFCLI